jgi:TPR repeat protein
MRWYRKAADQGYPRAQCELASAYYLGSGVPQDYAEALRWYRSAADQGDATGQNGVAYLYDQGKGVPRDYSEAVRWSRKAAEQGDTRAQHYLGYAYRWGQGVPQSYAEAARWYRKAAEQGDTVAQGYLGGAYLTVPDEPNPPSPRRDSFNHRPSSHSIGLIARNHHLRDAVARLDLVRLPAQVQQNHADLAAIARVDGRRTVRQRDGVLGGQAAARADLRLVSRRQLDTQPGGHQPRRARLQHRALHGPQIQAGILLGAVRVGRQHGVVSQSSDSYFHNPLS